MDMKNSHFEKLYSVLEATRKEMHEMFDFLAGHVKALVEDVDILKMDVSDLKSDVSELKSDVSDLKSDMSSVKGNYVTKAYLDQKFAEFGSDERLKTWKHNQALVDLMKEKKLFNKNDEYKLKRARFVYPR